MNYYKLFYWITVAERVQTFVLSLAIACTGLLLINIIVNIVGRYNKVFCMHESDKVNGETIVKTTNRFYAILTPCFFLFWITFIAVPSKSDTVLIVAGGAMTTFATSDSSARKIPTDVMSFVHEKIQELTREAKEDLGTDPKIKARKKLENELDGLTTEQLKEKILKDTTISKIAQPD